MPHTQPTLFHNLRHSHFIDITIVITVEHMNFCFNFDSGYTIVIKANNKYLWFSFDTDYTIATMAKHKCFCLSFGYNFDSNYRSNFNSTVYSLEVNIIPIVDSIGKKLLVFMQPVFFCRPIQNHCSSILLQPELELMVFNCN